MRVDGFPVDSSKITDEESWQHHGTKLHTAATASEKFKNLLVSEDRQRGNIHVMSVVHTCNLFPLLAIGTDRIWASLLEVKAA